MGCYLTHQMTLSIKRESIQKVSPVLLLMGVWLFLLFFSCCLVNAFLWGRPPGVELLGHGDYACSALVDSVRPHSQAAEPGCIPAPSASETLVPGLFVSSWCFLL